MAHLIRRILSRSRSRCTHKRITSELREDQECCVCLETHIPFKTLRPCLHEMCANCMKQFVTRRVNKCPLCRQSFNVEEHALAVLRRHVLRKRAKKSARRLLSRHDHSRHVQASTEMKTCMGAREKVEIVDVRTGVVMCTTVRDLEEQLRRHECLRMLRPGKKIYYFRKSMR
ncbi:unnamed protein product [Ectocarpus sp. 12 AP-2014]